MFALGPEGWFREESGLWGHFELFLSFMNVVSTIGPEKACQSDSESMSRNNL